MAPLEASIPSSPNLRISLNPILAVAPSNYLQLLAGPIHDDKTVGSPLVDSDKAGNGAGGGTSSPNSSTPEPYPGLDETICKARALYACTMYEVPSARVC